MKKIHPSEALKKHTEGPGQLAQETWPSIIGRRSTRLMAGQPMLIQIPSFYVSLTRWLTVTI